MSATPPASRVVCLSSQVQVGVSQRDAGQAGVVATQRNPIDIALDVFVFAPIGATIEFWERMPEHAKLGRERLGSQAPAARMIGEFAVAAGRKTVEARLSSVMPDQDRSGTPSPRPSAATTEDAPSDEGTSEASVSDATDVDSGPLPIEDYDGLPAVQIIPLLGSLDADERQVVRAHETNGRGRRTIIGKLDQLDARDE